MSASASGTIYASERFGVPRSLTAVMGLGAALSALLERIHPCEAVPPRAPRWGLHLARGCERALPLALPIGGAARPQTACKGGQYQDQALGACLRCAQSWLIVCLSILPISRRVKHSANKCIKSGSQGQRPGPGSAGGAAAPCRRPRRAFASRGGMKCLWGWLHLLHAPLRKS